MMRQTHQCSAGRCRVQLDARSLRAIRRMLLDSARPLVWPQPVSAAAAAAQSWLAQGNDHNSKLSIISYQFAAALNLCLSLVHRSMRVCCLQNNDKTQLMSCVVANKLANWIPANITSNVAPKLLLLLQIPASDSRSTRRNTI